MDESPSPRIKANPLMGDEILHTNGVATSLRIDNFWRWLASDLFNNTTRGRLAEWLVANDLQVADKIQHDWEAYDLETSKGYRVEVKSSAYVQSWHQNRLSKISFGVPEKGTWDPDTGKIVSDKCRQCDVFVFCVLGSKEQGNDVDVLNLDHWEFYVVSTKALNLNVRNQKTISLSRLKKLPHQCVGFGEIEQAINNILSERQSHEAKTAKPAKHQ